MSRILRHWCWYIISYLNNGRIYTIVVIVIVITLFSTSFIQSTTFIISIVWYITIVGNNAILNQITNKWQFEHVHVDGPNVIIAIVYILMFSSKCTCNCVHAFLKFKINSTHVWWVLVIIIINHELTPGHRVTEVTNPRGPPTTS